MEIKIELNRCTNISLSKQIYRGIADRVSSGLLEQGVKLPSIRNLAKALNVSMVTVSKAYFMLADDNIIETIQGKGTYVQVKNINNNENRYRKKENVFDWQLAIPDQLPRAQFWWQNISLTSKAQVWLSAASIYHKLLPEKTISKYIADLVLKNPKLISEYGPSQGDLKFRDAISKYLAHNNINISKNEVIITNGSQQAINLIARTFIGKGDVVIMEAPTYAAAIDVFKWQGATILSVPIDKDGMRMDLLLHLCEIYRPKLIYTIPTYHNPTGAVMKLTRRKELIEIAKDFNCIIVEDDPWSEISFEKNIPPSLKSMDDDGHVIYIKGLSKFLLPGCRMGALIGAGTILNRLMAAKSISDLASPLLMQKALLPFINTGFMKKHIKYINDVLYNRRNLVMKLLKDYMPSIVTWSFPLGGPNIWISLPPYLSAEILKDEAHDSGISFLTGATCYANEPGFNHLRVSFSSLSINELKNGIISLSKIVSEFIEKKDKIYD